ncbi:EscI/YscI/HrpB family type III secretion system inner rod protein [Noviherbaspirillum suwonense]|jgi:hypothetical protein|uniref:Type III secretion basal body protein I, YscI, HrpB, PscI n=1 Tax=Noviherbaspirillum suwonense TaxID=1224511 RepID=A0ABY1PUS6_9BURK|nr:EscI/YscI/HrpB family type III secretion system inner rod protein [Noviherbaspirillum suwonense]SMP45079.1 Type III secretion basal body protein I, YscI, HrpB, PscI [Noviherbaspirillum suwonense]
MTIETAVASRMRVSDDMAPTVPSDAQMSDDEMRAAGWLSEALSAPDDAGAASHAQPSTSMANMGDTILRGLVRVSDSYMKTAGELHTAIDGAGANSPSIQSALQMHMSFIEVSLQADTASKCISKSEQTVEQLVKQQ